MGFAALFGGANAAMMPTLTSALATHMRGLGQKWEIEAAGYVLKPYPCGAPLQRPVDAILALRARHAIDPDAVRDIRVGVSYLFAEVLIRHRPATGLEGRPSLPFCAASAMLDGRLGLDAFTDECVRDARVQAMMARVTQH